MNERDIDRALADGLGALAPGIDGADAALAAMRPRLQPARARRRLARTSVIALALVGLGSAAALAAPRGSGGRVHVSASTTVPRSTAATSSTHTSTSTTPTTARRSPNTTTTVPRSAAPASTVPLDHRSPGHGPGGPPSTAAPRLTPTPTPTVAPPQDRSYASPGGTVTLRLASGRLTLESYAPASGFHADVHTNVPDDIEVRFDNNTEEWRIRVRVRNGALAPEITRH